MPIIKRGKVEVIDVLPEDVKPVDDDETRKKIKEAQENKDK